MREHYYAMDLMAESVLGYPYLASGSDSSDSYGSGPGP